MAGMDLRDGVGGLLAGAGAGGQVAAEADSDLALDADIEEIGEAERGAVGLEAFAGDEAGGGAGQAEILLHLLRGGADLEAQGRHRAKALRQAPLDRVAGGRVRGARR